ncbi:hypothetical protein [Acidipila sp. EB88]|uniref:hypothetical protein n=1 Tax=Acidipila sp. EB88 TaxID=2305226 RepID=UPI000F5FF684|nr:hypothetical protein [Acidipila sp. EB88]RRA47680.1 hypothetical protein D1Y84_04605 [Acidipila sp. EB88]
MIKPLESDHPGKTPRGAASKWLFVILTVCLIAPTSLFVHDYMLETMKVPYPRYVGLPEWVKFINEVVRLFALTVVCRLSLPRLRSFSKVTAVIGSGLILMMLYETLRVWVIEGAITNSLVFSAYSRAPQAICLFLGGAAVAWTVLSGLKSKNAAGLIVMVAALLTFVIFPPLDHLFASLKNGMPFVKDLYSDPYPFKINVIIYISFVEPTIAAFAAAWLCWPALRGTLLRRALTFATLLLLVRGRFVQLLLQSFWVRLPHITAMYAVSQFFLETLVLAVLTALAWNSAERFEAKGR